MNLILRNRSAYPLSAHRLARPFNSLLENMLEEFISSPTRTVEDEGNYSPRIDVRENDQAYIVEADLPGVTKEHLKVTVDGQRISIEAEVRRDSQRSEGENVIHSERAVRKYTRSFEVAHGVDDTLTIAKLEHGVLTLNLPKKQASQSRLITIQ